MGRSPPGAVGCRSVNPVRVGASSPECFGSTTRIVSLCLYDSVVISLVLLTAPRAPERASDQRQLVNKIAGALFFTSGLLLFSKDRYKRSI